MHRALMRSATTPSATCVSDVSPANTSVKGKRSANHYSCCRSCTGITGITKRIENGCVRPYMANLSQ